MVKNTFMTFGFLVILLVSIAMVSATVENFSLTVVDFGEIGNPITGLASTIHPVVINLNNANSSVYINWTVASSTTMDLIEGNNYSIDNHTITGFNFTMPSSEGTFKKLTAHIYEKDNLSNKLGEQEVRIYFDTIIPGCMDIYANNYNPFAEVDNGLCAYTACRFDFEVNETGKLEIVDFNIDNLGNGDDDLWKYMDNIEFEVEIENTDNNDDIRNVEVKAIIMFEESDGNLTDVTGDFDFDEEIIDTIGKLKDNDKESVIFKIPEVPSDIAEGDYRLYLITYSDNNDEENCRSKYNDNDFEDDTYFKFEVEGVDYENAIIVKPSFTKTTVDTFCGENNIEVTIPVYNLYDEDEGMILVNIYNNELGIDEYKTIEDLRDGRHEEVTFFIDIPEGLDKEKYGLDIYLHFDWDDNKDEMDEFSYSEKTQETMDVKIIGCKIATPSIRPTLESETIQGTELVVKTIITNNGNTGDFSISVSGYESWAELVSVTPETATINEGEFIEATVILIPTESGMKSFKISTTVNGEIFNQPVSVKINEIPGIFGLSGLSGLSGATLYMAGGIAGILILILLVLIIKVASKKPVKATF